MDLIRQKWPNNWEYHISRYCNFYFCDKDIKYIDKSLWTENTTDCNDKISATSMNLRFQLGKYYYMVGINHSNSTHFSCSVFYRKPFKNSNNPFDIHISYFGGEDIFLLDDVAGIGGHDMTATDLMEFAEQMMWDDYNRREDRDDDDDDDGDNDPIEPSPTIRIAEPELIMI